jgi:hypothetical protein
MLDEGTHLVHESFHLGTIATLEVACLVTYSPLGHKGFDKAQKVAHGDVDIRRGKLGLAKKQLLSPIRPRWRVELSMEDDQMAGGIEGEVQGFATRRLDYYPSPAVIQRLEMGDGEGGVRIRAGFPDAQAYRRRAH